MFQSDYKPYAEYLIRCHGEEDIEALAMAEMYNSWHWKKYGEWPDDREIWVDDDDITELDRLIAAADVDITVSWND
jgi:hypothetical protein